jgi:hypothetical protein
VVIDSAIAPACAMALQIDPLCDLCPRIHVGAATAKDLNKPAEESGG